MAAFGEVYPPAAQGPLASFAVGQNSARSDRSPQMKADAQHEGDRPLRAVGLTDMLSRSAIAQRPMLRHTALRKFESANAPRTDLYEDTGADNLTFPAAFFCHSRNLSSGTCRSKRGARCGNLLRWARPERRNNAFNNRVRQAQNTQGGSNAR